MTHGSIEIASNDGYLLQHVIARGIPALGIEPAGNIAAVAEAKGIPTLNEFFSQVVGRGDRQARPGRPTSWSRNNVFAHIPDLNDFTAGLATILRPGGLLSIEVAYLVRLIERNEFDTIYHEHFMYYTVLSADAVLARHGLRVLDVEELRDARRLDPAYGSSTTTIPERRPTASTAIERRERAAGYGSPDGYGGFAGKVEATKRDLLEFLIDERRRGSTIAGYGAPGKGNTLLNYCGIRHGPRSTSWSTATPTSTAGSRRARTSPSSRRSTWPTSGLT